MGRKNVIKVDKKIKPIHFNLRKAPTLEIGKEYYVSFGNNEVKVCILQEIRAAGKMTTVSVSMPDGINSLYADELGLTPKEAVINQVTS